MNQIFRMALIAFLCAGLVVLPSATVAGCNTSQVEADIQKVLSEIPTALDIVTSIITIISASKDGTNVALVQQATAIAGQVSSDLKLASAILSQYKANLAGAPPTVIAQLDAAVAAAQTNLGSILTALHITDSKATEAIGFAVAGVQGVILGLESILPAKAAADFPRVSQNLAAIGAAPGRLRVKIESAHQVASHYNGKINRLFPKARVAVPYAHFLGFPLPFTHHAG